MRKILMAAVALTALSTTPAVAQDSADFAVSGSVTATCYANADGTIVFGTIDISSTTGLLVPNQTESSAPQNVWCNGVNSTLTYTGSSIVNSATTTDADFTSTLTFTPKVSIDGSDFDSGDPIGAIHGAMIVTAENLSDGGKLPVAGAYAGTITVTLTPSL